MLGSLGTEPPKDSRTSWQLEAWNANHLDTHKETSRIGSTYFSYHGFWDYLYLNLWVIGLLDPLVGWTLGPSGWGMSQLKYGSFQHQAALIWSQILADPLQQEPKLDIRPAMLETPMSGERALKGKGCCDVQSAWKSSNLVLQLQHEKTPPDMAVACLYVHVTGVVFYIYVVDVCIIRIWECISTCTYI